MELEIERKFLIKEKEWSDFYKPAGLPLVQGYLLTAAHLTIRVRSISGRGYITIKGISTGFSRPEYEYEIPVAEASELIASFGTSVIDKTRYLIIHEGKMWEIDEFKGLNAGLIMAEIELGSEQEEFSLPPWVGTEVTADKRYYNSYLAQHPFQKW